MGVSARQSEFGTLLRLWRTERRLSQADLADAIQTPPRHISFLENGRSQPSRQMIARLSSALEVPLREQNVLLQSAGFAAVFPSYSLADDEVGMLRNALYRIMEAQDPYPAFVFDRWWNVLDVNQGGQRLMTLIKDHFPFEPPKQTVNLVESVFSPVGFKPHIRNWEAYARQLIQRLQRESLCEEDLQRTFSLIKQHGHIPTDWWSLDVNYAADPAFPIQMHIEGLDLSFFTVVAAIALPTNLLAQEVRVETMFPADDATEDYLQQASQA